MAAFDEQTNLAWMEALDVGSGRLYFIKLANNETSWECPSGFLVRTDLVHAHAKLLSNGSGSRAEMGDEEFLARVRQRFPPPSTPQLTPSDPEALSALQLRVTELETENAALRAAAAKASTEKAGLVQTIEQLSLAPTNVGTAPPSCVGPPSCVAPPALGNGVKPPSWQRGASMRFANTEGPPPPPAWAMAQTSSSNLALNRRQSGAI